MRQAMTRAPSPGARGNPYEALVDGLRALGAVRLAAMGAVALGMLGMLALMVLRGGSDPMALLYGDLDPREAGQIVDQLNRRHVQYRIAANGGQVLVPADQVAETRMLLARDGLPSGGSIGYELFDRGMGLSVADSSRRSARRARWRARSPAPSAPCAVSVGVRVHLVLPRREPFARDRQDAQASVMLTMAGARRLDRESVQAILNLVAAAVPGLGRTISR